MSLAPSKRTRRWIETSLGGDAQVAWRRMTGGIASVVHELTIDHGTYKTVVVLRQYEEADSVTRTLVSNEAATLREIREVGLPAPELLAVDVDGRQSDGFPATLMTRLPGQIELSPTDPDAWLRQMAAVAVRIHAAPVAAAPFLSRTDAADPTAPATRTRPSVWKTAFDLLRQAAPDAPEGFLHRDVQHFNLLWQAGRLTGVVDWTMSCAGPVDFDIGHCRLNLAVLFDANYAERFRLAYEAEAGRATDPWWDLYAITAYSDEWRQFIPKQVAGRAPVDVDGMTARVDSSTSRFVDSEHTRRVGQSA